MSTATIHDTRLSAEHGRTARHGRPPSSAFRLLLDAVREGMWARERYSAMRRQGVPHADAIGRALPRD